MNLISYHKKKKSAETNIKSLGLKTGSALVKPYLSKYSWLNYAKSILKGKRNQEQINCWDQSNKKI